MKNNFNVNLRDSQYTPAESIPPERFDFSEYQSYEQELTERISDFLESRTGLLVYRRMRADGVYYDKAKDHGISLERQLGVLKKSLGFKADIPNFLEPWYGIGYIASSFGNVDYVWKENQAPIVSPRFKSAKDLLYAETIPLEESRIGKNILERIEYFLDKTKGKLPISFSDIQAPVNMLSYLIPMNNLCLEIIDDIESVRRAVTLVNNLQISFLKVQAELIGDCLVKPGHGFPSSREFKGIGESSDNVIMFSQKHYTDVFQPEHEKIGNAFEGLAFHSCGNWAHHAQMIKSFHNLYMVDAAFSPLTDPDPNDPRSFYSIFKDTNIILNGRCVGDAEEVYPYFRQIVNPHMKTIATTYCQDEKDQEKLYNKLHVLHQGKSAR